MPKRKSNVLVEVKAEDNKDVEAASSGEVRRSRGRPKGSTKPKKVVDPDTPKRGRGRPRLRPPPVEDPSTPPKRRGRPPNSPNKKKSSSPRKVTSRSPAKKGRPAGSKNKPKKRGRKPKAIFVPSAKMLSDSE